MTKFNRKLTGLLTTLLLASAANTTACVVLSEDEGHGEGHWDEPWSDCDDDECWDDCDEGDEHWDDDNNWEGDLPWDEDDDIDGEGGDDVDGDSEGDVDGELDGEGGEGDDPAEDCPAEDVGEVCGEDGQTYATLCDASRAHVRVAHEGPCGVACVFDADCELYEQCGEAGVCEPLECTEEFAPVCGVDGQTYGNACEAQAHHVAIAHDGECPPPCDVDADCELGDICEAGQCVAAECPEIAADDYSQEVCGADGFTYASACHARADHIEIIHEGCCVE